MKRPSRRRKKGSLFRLIGGWVLLVVGLILSIPLVPGPGFLFVFGGIALLSSESRLIRNLIRRHRDKRLIKRALREAERVGLKINLDADLDVADEESEPPDHATGSQS